jgi:curved DNA-binding protein CbpA
MQKESKEKYGADDFIEKPFQLSRLLSTVSGIIGEGDEPVAVESKEAAKAPPAERKIVMSGDLSTLTFPEVLHSNYVMGLSGSLVMTHDDVRKEIDIKQGYPVSVKTSIVSELFGNYMVTMRKITPEQNEESLARQKESPRLQGTILIEMDAITPQELVYFLKLQMRDKIFEIFSWREGEFEFTQDDSVTGDISAIDMSTANVIFFGIKNHFSMDFALDQLQPYFDKYLRMGSNQYYRFQELELTPSESKFLLGIDGTKTVGDLVMSSALSPLQTYHLLLALIYSGMCEPDSAKADQPDSFFNTMAETVEETPARPPIEAPAPPPPAVESDSISIDIPEPNQEEKAAPKPEPSPFSFPEDDDEPETEAEPKPAEQPAPSPTQDAERASLIKKIEEKHEILHEATLFEVLEVGKNPTEHEVRVSYHRLAKLFHPDKFFGNVSQQLKMKVEEIFRTTSEAYDHLNTQEKINKYIKELESEQSDEERKSSRLSGVKKIILAEQLYQNGQNFLREKRFTRASDAFRQGMEITNDPEYIAHYGWAMYNMPFEKDLDEEELVMRGNESDADFQFQGREHLNRAIQINPRTEKAYIFLGHVYRRQGLKEFAEKQFEKALICNPNSIEALRELRLIKLSDQKLTKKKGLLDRLLRR